MKGTDVAQLIDELQRLGFLGDDVSDDQFTADVSRATRQLNSLRGVDSNTISLAYFLWLPEPQIEGVRTEYLAGDAAPERLAPIFETLSDVTSAKVQVVNLQGGVVPYPSDELDRVISVGDGNRRIPVGIDQTIEDLSQLRPAVDYLEAELVSVRLELSSPRTVYQLPASSILANGDGETCVVLDSMKPFIVDVVGNAAGRVLIADDVADPVVANPVSAGLSSICGT